MDAKNLTEKEIEILRDLKLQNYKKLIEFLEKLPVLIAKRLA